MNMLIMTTPVSTGERYEFKFLAGMAKEAGYQLRVAERKQTSDCLLECCVDYEHINERHKADVDDALQNGKVYVVNGMSNMVKRGAIELCTLDESPIEKFAKIIGKTLSREDKIITALLASGERRNRKLHELGATQIEIRSAAAKVASI